MMLFVGLHDQVSLMKRRGPELVWSYLERVRGEVESRNWARTTDVHSQGLAIQPALANTGAPHRYKYVNMLTWKDGLFSSDLAALWESVRQRRGEKTASALLIRARSGPKRQLLITFYSSGPLRHGRNTQTLNTHIHTHTRH